MRSSKTGPREREPRNKTSPAKVENPAFTQPLPPGISVTTILSVQISYDPAKRDKVLAERGLDFAQAGAVFAGLVAEIEDTRRSYGEQHFVTAGTLDGRLVLIVWTPRNGSRRTISMRHAHDREEALWRQLLG